MTHFKSKVRFNGQFVSAAYFLSSVSLTFAASAAVAAAAGAAGAGGASARKACHHANATYAGIHQLQMPKESLLKVVH